jgi:hypothetical protein
VAGGDLSAVSTVGNLRSIPMTESAQSRRQRNKEPLTVKQSLLLTAITVGLLALCVGLFVLGIAIPGASR